MYPMADLGIPALAVVTVVAAAKRAVIWQACMQAGQSDVATANGGQASNHYGIDRTLVCEDSIAQGTVALVALCLRNMSLAALLLGLRC
jgi:hypothetical protein